MKNTNTHHKGHVVIIGAGFTGLAAAYELARSGIAVTILEKDSDIGGLAASFKINHKTLEKFYHHWFNNDEYIFGLAEQLGVSDRLQHLPSRTGIYLDNRFFKLSTPLQLLRFSPLSFYNRLRLGLLILQARRVNDWKKLESMTAEQWLLKMCGPPVYHLVWEPLLRGKFGPYASQVSAVWFWNKLLLRGGSRNRAGTEDLAYYRGGFAPFVATIADAITSAAGQIHTSRQAEGLIVEQGCVKAVQTADGPIDADAVIATPALPIIADLVEPYVSSEYLAGLKRIKYLANVCLVLELSESLSDIYWLNVNDPDFPFVGLIEHTNFQSVDNYGGRHIVYLSKYLSQNDEFYRMNNEQIFRFAAKALKRLFPEFQESHVQSYYTFKADYAQPVVVCNYSRLIPPEETPIKGLYIETMAQIYPQDRGTNYAVAKGRDIGRKVAQKLTNQNNV